MIGREILRAVARAARVGINDMRGPSKDATLVEARWAAMWLMRRQGMTLHQIGRVVGRGHNSVFHGLLAIEECAADSMAMRLLVELAPRFPRVDDDGFVVEAERAA